MEWVAAVAILALVEYLFFAAKTGMARGRYNVPAPATTGHPVFERTLRVQQNTLEQLIVFLPGLYLFSVYASPTFGALLGLVFVVGRALYYRGYVEDPGKRGPGFLVGFAANAVLLAGGLVGALIRAL